MGTKHGKKQILKPILSILALGNAKTGKTALVQCYEYMVNTNKEYDGNNNQPLDFDIKTITFSKEVAILDHTVKGEHNDDINLKVKIWDSPGNDRFYNITISAIKNIQGIILTYDITSRIGFTELKNWINKIQSYQDISEFPIIIVGCKVDLEDKREVSTEEGKEFAEEYKFPFFETSALTGKGVKEAFYTLIQTVYENNKNKKEISII